MKKRTRSGLLVSVACAAALGMVSTGAMAATSWCSKSQAGVLLIYISPIFTTAKISSNVVNVADFGASPPQSPADGQAYTCSPEGNFSISGTVKDTKAKWTSAFSIPIPLTANAYSYVVIAQNAFTLSMAGSYSSQCDVGNIQTSNSVAYMLCKTPYYQQ
ncbi:MAG: hypothetical protein NTZ67_01950 [Gammaproteobacteria bacterium]|nr:hypothetical protein [Gammaproteobacteria bacterium]